MILGWDSIFRLKNAPLACVAVATLHIGPSAQDSVQKFILLSSQKIIAYAAKQNVNLLLAVFVTYIGPSFLEDQIEISIVFVQIIWSYF